MELQERGIGLFVVIGAQRTGTNLLREILNTNHRLAMLAEVMTPNAAPAHFDNYLRTLLPSATATDTVSNTKSLLDSYFDYAYYRISNFWVDGDKSRVKAIGVDIKYNQLRTVSPAEWSCANSPYLVEYLRERGALIIHTTRTNVIHCSISALVAAERTFWHNYDGRRVDRAYRIKPQGCLDYARLIMRDREQFARAAHGCRIVHCRYEDLAAEIQDVPVGGEIRSSGAPLTDIADALGVPFDFRNRGKLQRAIDVPYSKLISNHSELVRAVRQSEFAELADSLVD
jgi:Sulfotransferase family